MHKLNNTLKNQRQDISFKVDLLIVLPKSLFKAIIKCSLGTESNFSLNLTKLFARCRCTNHLHIRRNLASVWLSLLTNVPNRIFDP